MSRGRPGVDPMEIPDMSGLLGPNSGTLHGLTLKQRFWLKVDCSDECWVWTGAVSSHGYGRIKNDPGMLPPVLQANRLAWELTQGPIPQDLKVCHTCDNPPCVRPSHLFLGTHSDNMLDAVAKGRHRRYTGEAAKGEDHPHAVLTEDREPIPRRSCSRAGAPWDRRRRISRTSSGQVARICSRKVWAHV